jgi:hypothetical protein
MATSIPPDSSDAMESPSRPWPALVAGIALTIANLILIREVGRWLVVPGWIGVGLFGVQVILTASGQRPGRGLGLLLAVTLLNFNVWAFSHLSNLMVYLGLYFFVLFGLVQGAALRTALMEWNAGKSTTRFITAVSILATWFGALALESAYYPTDAHGRYITRIRRLTSAESKAQIAERIPREARDHIFKETGHAGLLGYALWALQDGEVRFEVPGREGRIKYSLRHRRTIFVLRLVLSLGLLSFGIGVVVFKRPRTAT